MMEKDLKVLREMDVREVDPETLPDIADIHIDPSLPREERMASVLRQMNGNPYFFRCGKLVVKTSFGKGAKLQTLLEDCLEKL